MSPERYQQIKRLFDSVVALPPSERHRALDQLCSSDAQARSEVERLLVSDSQAGQFMQKPAVPPMGRLVPRPVRESLVGTRIGPYEILSEIGRGGMGTVYLASRADEHFRKLVAIKAVNSNLETEPIVVRFRRERQILANLEHPNIAQLLDGGTAPDGSPYLVMEYVGGMPLDEYCDSRQLPINHRLELFCTVCAAVHHAHQNLVVHRDLKPTNILVKADGTVKLLDFGIAKLLNPDPAGTPLERTATSMRIMTPEYASPEQARGDAITTATDVYTLGVVLYDLLTGRRPYRTLQEILSDRLPEKPSVVLATATGDRTPQMISAERATTPPALRRKLSGDLDAVALKALAKNPAARYGSVQQLADDVRCFLSQRPVSARGDTPAYRLSTFFRRHRAAVLSALLLLILLLAALGSAWRQVSEARHQQRQIQRQLEETQRQLESLQNRLKGAK